MAFLHAYIDDSACDAGDKRLFMAGYIQRADVWAHFADLWDDALHDPPNIDHFHMVDAYNLRGQFKGWSQQKRDAKLLCLASVIKKFDFVSFEFSVPQDIYFRELTPVSPRGLNPHFTCALMAVFGIARIMHDQNVDMPIKFIFDNREGTCQDIPLFFDQCIMALDEGPRRLISGTPQFERDEDLSPIQAADMLAWHIRRNHEAPNKFCKKILKSISGKYVISADHPKQMIKDRAESFSKITNIHLLKSKGEWQRLRRSVSAFKAAGYVPPQSGDLAVQRAAFKEFVSKLNASD